MQVFFILNKTISEPFLISKQIFNYRQRKWRHCLPARPKWRQYCLVCSFINWETVFHILFNKLLINTDNVSVVYILYVFCSFAGYVLNGSISWCQDIFIPAIKIASPYNQMIEPIAVFYVPFLGIWWKQQKKCSKLVDCFSSTRCNKKIP